MRMRRILACLVAAASIGCNTRALRGMGYTVGVDYWLAEMDSSMDPDDGPGVSEGDLGMDTEADIYSFTVSIMKGGRTRRQSERWTVGFWQAKYAGATVPSADLDFGSATFTAAGGKVSTDATFMAYRIAYEEETAGGTGGSAKSSRGESHRGWLGLAFFTFDVDSEQKATGESYSFDKKNIPAITVGYRMETRQGTMTYFASADYMDLAVFKMGGVTGQHLDLSAGIKWTFSPKMFLTTSYRYYEGEYSYSGNKAHFTFQGVTIGGEITF